MMAHMAAVDLMAEGLTGPSASLWSQGAEVLIAAPLRRKDMPNDPKLTDKILVNENHVHALAERARHAADGQARVEVYGEMIQACGTCHALHGNVWGPARK